MKNILFFDATLRDGNHAISHQISKKTIEEYCNIVDNAGLDVIIVGHGNGIGASSLQVGLSKLSEEEMFNCARANLKNTKLGTYMIPGFGTIRDNIEPAIKNGVELFKIGCNCTEADITRQHIEYLANNNKDVYGVLMMFHITSIENLIDQAKKMQSYGAKGVILMDSAGYATPEMVKKTISSLYDNLDIRVGFHAHNNLGLAVSNTYTAIQNGASIIDGTTRGFGAGAGNCQLEAIVALLEKEEIKTGINLYKLMDASEKVISKIWPSDKGIDDISIVNGIAGTFSAFKKHALAAAERYGVDARDILMEAGRRKTVAGQEDILVQIAQELKQKKEKEDESYYLSSLL